MPGSRKSLYSTLISPYPVATRFLETNAFEKAISSGSSRAIFRNHEYEKIK